MGSKFRKKVLDTTRKSGTYACKTASNRAIQKKTAEATSNQVGKKIVEKINKDSFKEYS